MVLAVAVRVAVRAAVRAAVRKAIVVAVTAPAGGCLNWRALVGMNRRALTGAGAGQAGSVRAGMVGPGILGPGILGPEMVGPEMVGPGMARGGTARSGTSGTGTNQARLGGRRVEVRGSPDGSAAVADPLVARPALRWLVTRGPAAIGAATPRPAIRGRARAVFASPRRVTAMLAAPAPAVAGVAVLGVIVTGAAIAQIAAARIAGAGSRVPGCRVARPRRS